MEKIYSGSSLEECIDKASIELGIDTTEIEYKIKSEKKGFFKKSCEIVVCVPEKECVDGKIKVLDGKIIVKDPGEGGRKATIASTRRIRVFVDDKEVKNKMSVDSSNIITWKSVEEDGDRKIQVHISEDRIEATVDIELKNCFDFKIKNCDEMTDLIVGDVIDTETEVERFTPEEIVLNLRKHKISNGINVESINSLSMERSVKGVVVAKGKAAIEGTDDKLIINYNENNAPVKDENGNVDFKAIGHIDTIQSGESLCQLIPGEKEEDGIDVYGKVAKARKCKRININPGKGCLREGDKIIAEITGKAVRRGYTFSIEPVYVINGNVDVSTGDVKFDGNIEIFGEVTEGMMVESGSSIVIHQGTSGANIKSQSNITINGNVMTCDVASGGDAVLQKKIQISLSEICNMVIELNDMAHQVFQSNVLGENIRVGEVFKILIERRYKKLNIAIEEYRKLVKIKYGELDSLSLILKERLTGFGPLNIQSFDEVEELKMKMREYLSILEMNSDKKSDMVLEYIQDSKIMCQGDVFINGKGEYVSEIIANGNIYFSENSVARGGYLRASGEIRCNVVGSSGKVRTTLHVEKDGKISIQRAFANTKIIIGKFEYVVEEDCRNVLAYADSTGGITVEKIK